MLCKKCKKRIKKDYSVCPYCGAPQTETVSLGAIHAANENRKRLRKAGKRLGKVLLIVLAVVLAVAIALVSAAYLFLDQNIQHGSELDESQLGINEELPETGVMNIALFGLDNRTEATDGHSDAIIILSIDRDHNKIKMTSIARDILVKVDGYWSKNHLTKITHAFSYGAQKKDLTGPGVAVKTINQNFGMNINRYMYVNFQGFAEIIDFLGGITIDVKQHELYELNNRMKYTEQQCGVKITRVKKAGEQRLDGWQALVYARIRKMDSDIARGNRQKDVLQAAFNEVKDLPMTKFPSLIAQGLQMCHTNLTSSEILSIATWAVTSSPEIVNSSIPDENNTFKAWGGSHPDYDWVWIMDLNYATARLHDFIYETKVSENMTPRRYSLGGTIPIP